MDVHHAGARIERRLGLALHLLRRHRNMVLLRIGQHAVQRAGDDGLVAQWIASRSAEYRKRRRCHRYLRHPEEPRDARRLEGWTTRTSMLRDAPQKSALL